MPNMIQIVSPVVRRGKPPRDLLRSDMIWVPVDYGRGMWNLETIVRFTKAHRER